MNINKEFLMQEKRHKFKQPHFNFHSNFYKKNLIKIKILVLNAIHKDHN